MSECAHMDFEAEVQVYRIEDKGEFAADVHIRCALCKRRFYFLGMPMGVSSYNPTVSLDGTEARLPIALGGLYDENC